MTARIVCCTTVLVAAAVGVYLTVAGFARWAEGNDEWLFS